MSVNDLKIFSSYGPATPLVNDPTFFSRYGPSAPPSVEEKSGSREGSDAVAKSGIDRWNFALGLSPCPNTNSEILFAHVGMARGGWERVGVVYKVGCSSYTWAFLGDIGIPNGPTKDGTRGFIEGPRVEDYEVWKPRLVQRKVRVVLGNIDL
jgi:hypothetical protein